MQPYSPKKNQLSVKTQCIMNNINGERSPTSSVLVCLDVCHRQHQYQPAHRSGHLISHTAGSSEWPQAWATSTACKETGGRQSILSISLRCVDTSYAVPQCKRIVPGEFSFLV